MQGIMKNILLTGLAAASLLLSGCQDKLEEDFYNPENYQAPENKLAAGLFTKTLYEWQVYVQDYGEWWWSLTGAGVTAYAQVGVRPTTQNYAGIYQDFEDVTTGNGFSADNGIRNYFNNMYTKMKTWSIFKQLVEEEYTGETLTNSYVYYQLTTVMKDYTMLRNIDFFNSIPYYNAIQGNKGILFAEYDDPLEVTKTILDELKEISESIVADYDKMSPDAKATFAKQDVAFKGDIQLWKQYINALRLKFAVRMSAADEAYAKTQIASAIQDGLPTKDMIWLLPTNPAKDLPGGGNINRGWFERFTSLFIPNVILERMNHNRLKYEPGIDDPRLPAIAAPTRYNDYRGIRMDNLYHQPAYDSIAAGSEENMRPDYIDEGTWERHKSYINNNTAYRDAKGTLSYYDINCVSMYNPATYYYANFPVYMFSLAETELLLAEVAARNYASTGKTAGEHISDAMTHSTDLWYYINSLSVSSATDYPRYFPEKPSAEIVQTYGDFLKAEYQKAKTLDDQIEIIMQQKYIHLNLMAPNECWTELRRTRHPKLEPVNFPPYFTNIKPQVERIKYPDSEELNNTENFAKVKAENNYSSPIYYVPQDKRSESYYRDTFIEIEKE